MIEILKIFFYKLNNKFIFLILKYLPFQFKYFFLPFPKHQFGLKPRKTKEYYINLFKKFKNIKYPKIDKFEKKFKKKIKKKFIDDLALATQIVIKKKSKINYQHGRILYAILFDHIKKNKIKNINILETGTARGFSSVCMSKAIIDSRIQGSITTIDIIPNNLNMYWNVISDHTSSISRAKLLQKWSEEIKRIKFIQNWSYIFIRENRYSKIRYNFAFLDGAHNFKTVLNEFLFIRKNQKKNDLIFFDDVSDTFKEMIKFKNFLHLNFKEYEITLIKCDRERSYMLAKKIN